MELITDGLLFIATMVAALYCLVLSRRLRRLTDMDAGVGEAITAMSTRVDEMNNALTSSQKSTQKAVADLDTRLAAAKAVLTKLEAATSSSQDQARAIGSLLQALGEKEQEAEEKSAMDDDSADEPDLEDEAETVEEPAEKPRPVLVAKRDTPAKPVAKPRAKPAAKAVTKAVAKPRKKPAESAPEEAEEDADDLMAAAVEAALSEDQRHDHELLARRLIAALTAKRPVETVET